MDRHQEPIRGRVIEEMDRQIEARSQEALVTRPSFRTTAPGMRSMIGGRQKGSSLPFDDF